MEYSKIISVTGLPGLYELVGSKTDGAIVRSLDDKTVKFISSRQHNFSHLESVEVYTVGDNVNLAEIFTIMGGSEDALPSEKDAKAIRAYFDKVYPDLDFDRVYPSDMKKMVKWFSVLKENGIEIKLSEAEEEETEEEETEAFPADDEAPKEEAPTPAKAAKKKAAKEEPVAAEAPAAEEEPKKPAKKKAAKAEASEELKEDEAAPKKKAAKK